MDRQGKGLEVFEGISHAQYLVPEAPETKEAFAEIRRLLDAHLGK
jgi:epsilon-lactone hydrolase